MVLVGVSGTVPGFAATSCACNVGSNLAWVAGINETVEILADLLARQGRGRNIGFEHRLWHILDDKTGSLAGGHSLGWRGYGWFWHHFGLRLARSQLWHKLSHRARASEGLALMADAGTGVVGVGGSYRKVSTQQRNLLDRQSGGRPGGDRDVAKAIKREHANSDAFAGTLELTCQTFLPFGEFRFGKVVVDKGQKQVDTGAHIGVQIGEIERARSGLAGAFFGVGQDQDISLKCRAPKFDGSKSAMAGHEDKKRGQNRVGVLYLRA
jgi:hypothetical protein